MGKKQEIQPTMVKKKGHRRGFSQTKNRENKALKIETILSEVSGSIPGKSKLLDIGTGNGEIAYFIGKSCHVFSLDIEDNRETKKGYNFLLANEQLPFRDDHFDYVVSNHIIEHVSDPRTHLKEIARVLKKNGTVYLATPNRSWPWEVHYRIPLLHYLPHSLFSRALKSLKIHHEDLQLFTLGQLQNLLYTFFTVSIYSDKVCRFPRRYHMMVSPKLEKLLHLVPLKAFSLAAPCHPTLIVILKKKQNS